MAPRRTSKKKAATRAPQRTSLDDAAAFIGGSLGELMNRKDALAKQLATVERQIAAARDRLTATVGSVVARKKPAGTRKSAKPAERKGNRKRKRPMPPDDPAVKARTRAAQAEAKGRTSERLKTSMRGGNR